MAHLRRDEAYVDPFIEPGWVRRAKVRHHLTKEKKRSRLSQLSKQAAPHRARGRCEARAQCEAKGAPLWLSLGAIVARQLAEALFMGS